MSGRPSCATQRSATLAGAFPPLEALEHGVPRSCVRCAVDAPLDYDRHVRLAWAHRAVVAFQAWSFARRLSACRAGAVWDLLCSRVSDVCGVLCSSAVCRLLCSRASVCVHSSGTRYDEQVRDLLVASSGAPAWEEQAVGRGAVVQQALALVHHGHASARECLQ